MNNSDLSVTLQNQRSVTGNLKGKENVELTHDALQAACHIWHHNTFPEDRHLVHANLNNSVGVRRGNHNKAIGVKKGRADLQYLKAGVLYLFEFKVGSDRQKPEQKAFQAANEAEGAVYVIIRSEEQYQATINAIRSL
ncbi:hypothetical protein [Spirosoma fluminis]